MLKYSFCQKSHFTSLFLDLALNYDERLDVAIKNALFVNIPDQLKFNV